MLVEVFWAILAAAPQAPEDVTEAAAAVIERLDIDLDSEAQRRATREQTYYPVEGAETKPEPGRTIRLPD